MDSKSDKTQQNPAAPGAIGGGERWVDPGQALRYSADTQDQAYRSGAYDIVETLDFAPRIAVQAGYVMHFGAASVLDVGCGTGELLKYLGPEVHYVGLDISPTAVETARQRYARRPRTDFFAANFREWQSPRASYDCIVWAGIGRTWTRGGRKGDKADWLDVLRSLDRYLAPAGFTVIEATRDHWPKLSQLIKDDYEVIAGCDVDCLVNDHRAVRAARVIRPRSTHPAGEESDG